MWWARPRWIQPGPAPALRANDREADCAVDVTVEQAVLDGVQQSAHDAGAGEDVLSEQAEGDARHEHTALVVQAGGDGEEACTECFDAMPR